MYRVLPYLGGVLFVALLALVVVLTYRYITRNDRLAPKRELQRQILRLKSELVFSDNLIHQIEENARLWRNEEPNSCDTTIIKITDYKSRRALRDKELN